MFILLVFKELEITISYTLSYYQWPWLIFKHPSINRRSFSRVSSSAAPCNEAGPVNSDGHHSWGLHLLTYPSLKWNDSKRRAKDYRLFFAQVWFLEMLLHKYNLKEVNPPPLSIQNISWLPLTAFFQICSVRTLPILFCKVMFGFLHHPPGWKLPNNSSNNNHNKTDMKKKKP